MSLLFVSLLLALLFNGTEQYGRFRSNTNFLSKTSNKSSTIGQKQKICNYHDLYKELTNTISIRVRPTKHWLDASVVVVNILLYAIVNLDMNKQTITTYLWLYMPLEYFIGSTATVLPYTKHWMRTYQSQITALKSSWPNDFSTWDPEKYCGIDRILVPYKNFWRPDVLIDELNDSDEKPNVIPYYKFFCDGTVILEKPLRSESTCTLNIFKFPFDTQTCRLTFKPYVYKYGEVQLKADSSSVEITADSKSLFASKGEWSLLNIDVVDEGFQFVQFKISIKRTPLKYVTNLIIPAILMVVVDVFSMLMHSYADRLGFKITVVLGFFVLLLILNNILPNSASPPILGIFCCACMAMMIFTIIGSVLASYMMELSFKQSKVPSWMRMCLRILARILCFKSNIAKDLETVTEKNNDCYSDNKTKINLKSSKKKRLCHRKMNMEVKLLKMILAEIVKIHEQWNTNIKKDNTESEWYTAALVVDRIFLILYLVYVISMFIIMFVSWYK